MKTGGIEPFRHLDRRRLAALHAASEASESDASGPPKRCRQLCSPPARIGPRCVNAFQSSPPKAIEVMDYAQGR
jgi:hypothetical protein